ncbi:Gamma-secretase subunit PEN-2 [Bagarius yarrelli]|uniref:Gamma-secretase subunit PEN-2 n=1 Tax=Bagarius yarrelli TaxID=175774 RepID=A0A556U5X6_BAGYA|nr:Gamma-secretase subunit PEN-2 [Bagarius yarrelli]
MNLERVSNEEKLNLCRKYYLGGFAFLPFLWLVNVVWFFKEAFVKPAYTEQPQIKIYVKRSALGLILWVAVLTTWITIFQHFRAQWGEVVCDQNGFTVQLDVKHFSPEELMVKVTGNYVVVEGKHEQRKDGSGLVSRQFNRRYRIPNEVDAMKLECAVSPEGMLVISAPLLKTENDKSPTHLGVGV